MRHWTLWIVCAAVAACASPRPRNAGVFPEGTGPVPPLSELVKCCLEAHLGEDFDVLLLSGGAQNGAFGAGVLRGWRQADRPRFDVVLGASTGALLSSHAFIDTPEADREVSEAYTHISKQDVLCKRGLFDIVRTGSLMNLEPLQRRLAVLVDNELIDRVAEASEEGKRLLLVTTVDMDRGQTHVWELGSLARHRQYEKYRAILLASASPPVGAVPVFLDGEMHVDGGTISSVYLPSAEQFLSPSQREELAAQAAALKVEPVGRITVHIIVNGVLQPRPLRVEAGLEPIAMRAFELLRHGGLIGSLWQIYARLQEQGGRFRLVAIPDARYADAREEFAFDSAAMGRIHAAGLALGREQAKWLDRPPVVTAEAGGRRGPAAVR